MPMDSMVAGAHVVRAKNSLPQSVSRRDKNFLLDFFLYDLEIYDILKQFMGFSLLLGCWLLTWLLLFF